MQSKVRPLRLKVDSPGDFLEWLIEKGFSLRSAGLMISDVDSDETQTMLRRYMVAERAAS